MLFLGKKDNFYAEQAGEFIRLHFPDAKILYVARGEPVYDYICNKERKYIISFLSPYIIPKDILDMTGDAINFHPGPPEYPGIGCTNFAIYEGAKKYGVTCHYMEPKVDSGDVLSVRFFDVHKTDTVYSLTQKCYAFMLTQFYTLMDRILNGFDFDENDGAYSWCRPASTRKDFNNLRRITTDMDTDEIQRRIKATTFPGYPSVFLEHKGKRYVQE